MKVIIEINCDNASFDKYPATELQNILGELSKNIHCWPYDIANIPNKPIFDSCGNNVGFLKIEE